MARDTTTDEITNDLIKAYVKVLSPLAGWGTLADGSKAVYPVLDLPQPQEPYPGGYVFFGGQDHGYGQGTGVRQDFDTIILRIIGGPSTPRFKFNPEVAVYKMITAVANELSWRSYLQDPTNNNDPFRYIDPQGKVALKPIGRITAFRYEGLGDYIGIEIATTVTLSIPMGRVS